MPRTTLGKWSGGLAALFAALLVTTMVSVTTDVVESGSLVAIVLGTIMMATGAATFVVSVVSLVKAKDHS